MKEQHFRIQECFGDIFKEIASDGKNKGYNFMTKFQIYNYVFENMSDEQILKVLPDIMHYAITIDKDKILFWKTSYKIWKSFIEKEHKSKIGDVMTLGSISVGEAMILVDDAFDKQVGYLAVFADCLSDLFKMTLEKAMGGDNNE